MAHGAVTTSGTACREEIATPSSARHPNELDQRRVTRALLGRHRYRYVTPTVRTVEHGYLITSPNCSRNIDADGGEIEIALVQFEEASARWRLFYMNHVRHGWSLGAEANQLTELLSELCQDPLRRYWP